MSDPARKRTAKATWDAMMGAFPADDAERIAALTEDEVDRELRAEGVDPEEIAAIGAAVARGERAPLHVAQATPQVDDRKRDAERPRPKHEKRGERISFRTRATVLLAAAAVILLLVYSFRGEIVAFFTPSDVRPEIGPDNGPYDMRSPEQRKAAELRKLAFSACERDVWDSCLDELNAAARLDPAGEADARVQQWRAKLAAVPHGDAAAWKAKGP